ncbi:MAG: hypothetical protein F4Y01_06165, partial [Gammaproteobacteria bacterium]|nr:hypothetical protein [Gammaproteobacteria bacterium]
AGPASAARAARRRGGRPAARPAPGSPARPPAPRAGAARAGTRGRSAMPTRRRTAPAAIAPLAAPPRRVARPGPAR